MEYHGATMTSLWIQYVKLTSQNNKWKTRVDLIHGYLRMTIDLSKLVEERISK